MTFQRNPPEGGQAGTRPMETTQIAAVLAGLTDPVMIVGSDNAIVLANRAADDLLGPGLAGQPVHGVLRQPEALAALERGLGTHQHGEARIRFETAGSEITFRLIVHPLHRATAGLDGVVVSLNDISHVEEAEQMRRDFVANVSHELRSPLTALLGFVETLRGAARHDPAARERFLSIMEAEAQRMNRLIADLLSLSKVETSERVRPREAINLADVLGTTIAALRPLLQDRDVTLEQDYESDRLFVIGDSDQLTQVFHNLLENAIKYGATGGKVVLRARREEKVLGFPGPVIRVDVQDQGEGIAAEHIPRLTERFYRVDNHRSRTMGGTGLGLAIVKHIVNRHRGRLQISSVQGKGSTFSVILPVL